MKKILTTLSLLFILGGVACQSSNNDADTIPFDIDLATDESFSILQYSNNGNTDLPFSCLVEITVERGTPYSILTYKVEPLSSIPADYEGFCPSTLWTAPLTDDEISSLLPLVASADLYNTDYPEITAPEGTDGCYGAVNRSLQIGWYFHESEDQFSWETNTITIPADVQCDDALIPEIKAVTSALGDLVEKYNPE